MSADMVGVQSGEVRPLYPARQREDGSDADRLLQPVFCLRAGERHDAIASILPMAVAA